MPDSGSAADIKPITFRRWIATNAFAILALVLVAGSVFFSGVLKHGDAKNIDGRYFYVAAKCWAAGQSPYVTQIFASRYIATFGVAPNSVFAGYPPTLMLIVLPLALFTWPVAAWVFALANFAAVLVLFWACSWLVREALGHRLRPAHWFWVVIACTLGGISGTIFTGQTSVFITAAIAIALVGCRSGRSWLTIVGLAVASAKPHLSAPVLLLILWLEPKQRAAILAVMGIAVALSAYAVALDPHFVHTYLSAMSSYNGVIENDPAREFGLVSLLLNCGLKHGVAQIIGLVCEVAVIGQIVWCVRRSAGTLTSSTPVMMLLIFSAALALPIHPYDLCCYATGIAVIATLTRRFQFALCIPALLIWRPALLHKLDPASMPQLLPMLAWLILLICSSAMVVARVRVDRSLA